MLRLVGHVGPKVAAHDAVPGGVVLLVKLLLNESRNVLWDEAGHGGRENAVATRYSSTDSHDTASVEDKAGPASGRQTTCYEKAQRADQVDSENATNAGARAQHSNDRCSKASTTNTRHALE